ncbi:response regulator [Cognatishimia sp. F0-27]|uniref:response regulator n=1 Tax=Cognatishimia sp. F0-27 TaxID=2816855 RepID=UPI001D0C8778|nr:response regulator [Cognatishimia sp. F0-27]MCC1492925.1 response regulator [Cognatishimia sp. F0-27]
MKNDQNPDLSALVAENLPFLRRYARALTGSQSRGDSYALATLEAILSDPSSFDGGLGSKAALFKVFHGIWSSSGAPLGDEADPLASKAQEHLSRLTFGTREALLLHTIEGLSFEAIGQVMELTASEAQELVEIAYNEMAKSVSGRVMVIEDEAIIAFDLEAIIADMGHKITGVARTETGAIQLANRETPDLILSDIQLADNSSGIDAVNKILESTGDIPVIFITAFPERLLTGDGPEPAFLISKPYTEDQVRSAVSQAMFFSSTETLKT